jgi:phosphoribosylformylglycinamidine synthase
LALGAAVFDFLVLNFEFSPKPTLESRRGTLHSAGMKAKVTVMPKKSVLDPQGVAVREAMRHHGLPGVKSVRIGKFMEIEVDQANEEKLHEICRDLLSNPVIEDYEIQVEK